MYIELNANIRILQSGNLDQIPKLANLDVPTIMFLHPYFQNPPTSNIQSLGCFDLNQ